MEEGNNLFSKIKNVEDIEKENNKLLLELLNKNNNISSKNDIYLQTLINSRKSYRWYGSINKFNAIKQLLVLVSFIAIFFNIISTISTSLSFNIYSTFSLFENIYIIFIMFNLKNILKTKYIYESKELVNNSSFIYNKNNIGMDFLVKDILILFR